jgi:uncharacterized phage protein (TIGR02218 family)
MKAGAAAINTHIAGVVTTIAECYRLELKDGTVLGLTGHDDPIIYDGVTYLPSLSVSRSAISSQQNLSVDNLDITGLIDSTYITDEDLIAGRYDGAALFIFFINYVTPANGIIKLRRGTLGNIVYESGQFRAEVRGMLQSLNKEILRIYSPECDAEFGDSTTGCGFDLSTVTQTGSVSSVTDKKNFVITGVTITGAEFRDGRMVFTTGLNAGVTLEIKDCDVSGNVELFLSAPFTVTALDEFTITQGCLKSLAACILNSQVDNFRGFPFIRGNKDLLKYETGNM